MIKIEKLTKKFRVPIEDFEIIKKLFFVYNYSSKNLKKDEFYSLKNINLEIKDGEKIFILGSSGSGKTTLFSVLSNKINYDEGLVEKSNNFFSSTLINMPPNLFPRLKLNNFIKILASFYKINNNLAFEDLKKNLLELLNISDEQLNTNFYEMDKSLFKSIIFALSCFTDNKIYLFDNFNFDFQNHNFNKIWEKFLINSQNKICLFFSCNNLKFIKDNADKIIVMENSQIKKFDKVENFSEEELKQNFKLKSDEDLIEEDDV
mgnify:CR=1 FL=1